MANEPNVGIMLPLQGLVHQTPELVARFFNHGPTTSSSQEAQPELPQDANLENVECLACNDNFNGNDVLGLPCGHHFCQICAAHMCDLALRDISMFPPICCQNTFELAQVRIVLSPPKAEIFRQRLEEFKAIDNTYCYDRNCSARIPEGNFVNNTASCQSCGQLTCKACMNAGHDGECPTNVEVSEVLRLAEHVGWRRCTQCRQMVERKYGCNHMICVCKHSFCYACGTDWGNCSCSEQLADEADFLEQLPMVAAPRPRWRLADPAMEVELEEQIRLWRLRDELSHQRHIDALAQRFDASMGHPNLSNPANPAGNLADFHTPQQADDRAPDREESSYAIEQLGTLGYLMPPCRNTTENFLRSTDGVRPPFPPQGLMGDWEQIQRVRQPVQLQHNLQSIAEAFSNPNAASTNGAQAPHGAPLVANHYWEPDQENEERVDNESPAGQTNENNTPRRRLSFHFAGRAWNPLHQLGFGPRRDDDRTL